MLELPVALTYRFSICKKGNMRAKDRVFVVNVCNSWREYSHTYEEAVVCLRSRIQYYTQACSSEGVFFEGLPHVIKYPINISYAMGSGHVKGSYTHSNSVNGRPRDEGEFKDIIHNIDSLSTGMLNSWNTNPETHLLPVFCNMSTAGEGLCEKRTPEGCLVDGCLLKEIVDLNAQGIKTVSSCCGHRTMLPIIEVVPEHVGAMLIKGYLQAGPCLFMPKSELVSQQ